MEKKLTNIEFVKKLQEIATKYKTVYGNGMFGQPITENIIVQKSKQLPNWYTTKRQQELRALIGQGYFGFDCICLIKGVLWGWDGDLNQVNGGAVYNSNGVPDITEYGMLQQCSDVSENFAKIEVGEYLWTDGHCGIYVGEGMAVECTPKWDNCVQITAVANISPKSGYNDRIWKKHGKLPYVEYEKAEQEEKPEYTENVTVKLYQLSKGILNYNPQVYTLQRLLKELGHYNMEIDGLYGGGTEKAVIAFQKAKKIAPDGIVGQETWNKLLK